MTELAVLLDEDGNAIGTAPKSRCTTRRRPWQETTSSRFLAVGLDRLPPAARPPALRPRP